MMTLDQLNQASVTEFVALLDGTYEHSPWIAERAAAARPFKTLAALKVAMETLSAERPEDALARAQLRHLIERKLDELPDSFASVFVLRGIEELSVEETAQSLGIPEATVRSRYFRARGLLRASLAQDLDLAQKNAFAFDGSRCDRIVATLLERQRRHNPLSP